MSSQINLEAMDAAGLGYVTRLSALTLRSLVEELALEKQLELGDRQKLMEISHEGKRYVIAGGQWRQQRDQERRQSRIAKAEAELKRLAAVKRKKIDVQKLASQVGRTLQRLKAHKYFSYSVDAQGQLQWERKRELIAQEAQQDGWYLLHTNEPADRCPGEQVLAHYKGLLDVEEAFCELKSYLEVRPIPRPRGQPRAPLLSGFLAECPIRRRMARQRRNRGSSARVATPANHPAGSVADGTGYSSHHHDRSS